MIKKYSNNLTILQMCKILSVSKSGYYSWLNRKPSKREIEDKKLATRIKEIFDEEKQRAGAERISKRLKFEKWLASKRRVGSIMKRYGWRAKAAKKFKATTNSNHKLPVAVNLLNQNFVASRPNEKWVSDINGTTLSSIANSHPLSY